MSWQDVKISKIKNYVNTMIMLYLTYNKIIYEYTYICPYFLNKNFIILKYKLIVQSFLSLLIEIVLYIIYIRISMWSPSIRQNMDEFPFIWKDLRKRGYVTQWAEDSYTVGTFTYRFVGFGKQPVDHYMRNYFVSLQNSYKECIGLRSI